MNAASHSQPPARRSARSGTTGSVATSRSLIARLVSQENTAWEQMVQLYSPLVWRWCRRQGLHEDDAADVFQEVFQSIAVHIGGFRKTRPKDTFRGWLRVITRNKVHDHFRRRRKEPQAPGGTDLQLQLAEAPAPEVASSMDAAREDEPTITDESDDRHLLRRALEQIQGQFRPRTWQAFLRTALQGQTARDVATDLDMSPGAVRVARSRVLQRLRTEIGDLN